MPNKLLEKSGEVTPERMKRQSQSKKQCPVVDGTGDGNISDAVKYNIAKESGMSGP